MINLDKKTSEIIYLISGLVIMMLFSHSYIGLLIGAMCAIPVLKGNNYINITQIIQLKDKMAKWFEERPYMKKILFFTSIAFCLFINIIDFFDISVEHFSPFGDKGIRYMMDDERILGGIGLLINSVALVMLGLLSWIKKFFSSVISIILILVTIIYMAVSPSDVGLVYQSMFLLLTTAVSTFYVLNKIGFNSKKRTYSIIMAILLVIGGFVYWNINSKYSDVNKVFSNKEFPAEQTEICKRLLSVGASSDVSVECFINQCSEYFYFNDNKDNMAEVIKHNAELINNKKYITNVKSSYMKRTFAKIEKMCK